MTAPEQDMILGAVLALTAVIVGGLMVLLGSTLSSWVLRDDDGPDDPEDPVVPDSPPDWLSRQHGEGVDSRG